MRIRNSKRPLLLQFVATWAFLILKTDRVFNIILSMVYQDRLGPDVTTRKLKEGACRVSYSWLTQLSTLKTSSSTTCKKPSVVRYHSYTKNASFYQDRLGTNIGKILKKWRFHRCRRMLNVAKPTFDHLNGAHEKKNGAAFRFVFSLECFRCLSGACLGRWILLDGFCNGTPSFEFFN
eukprot:COSAG06_NODE_1843_length_8232_cov_21.062585_3_plen_178_part_00